MGGGGGAERMTEGARAGGGRVGWVEGGGRRREKGSV